MIHGPRRYVSLIFAVHHTCLIACKQDSTKEWLPYRDICLDEMLRHEGLGERSQNELSCEECGTEDDLLRCADSHCVGAPFLCASCMVRQHERLPLHRIQVRLSYLIHLS